MGQVGYVVRVVGDDSGPVLFYAQKQSGLRPPYYELLALQQWAAETGSPRGLVCGIWQNARSRLSDSEASLEVRVVSSLLQAHEAARLTIEKAREARVAAWLPDELSGNRERSVGGFQAVEPLDEVPCQSCHILRRREQLDGDGLCLDGCP